MYKDGDIMIGIDVSEHNGAVNWNNIDCNFAIIRTGFGYADEDGQLSDNVKNCNVPYGFYHFSYATGIQSAVVEANFVLDLLKKHNAKPTLPIFFDWEYDSERYAESKGIEVNKHLFEEMAVAFMEIIKAAGYKAGIYYNHDYYKNYCTPKVLDRTNYYQWFAYYGDSINIDCDLWQNSENGIVSGFKGDTNILINEDLLKGDMAMSRVLKTGENQITNPFGNGHRGIDIVKKTNSLDYIMAHSDGVVTWCQSGIPNDTASSGNRSYGNAVKIKHDNGYYTLYAHMQYINVNVGMEVSKGQIIGYMGNTGNSYGAHLHFEVRNASDVVINPTSYIDYDLPNLPTGDVKPLPTPTPEASTKGLYTVKFGDTLTSIANAYNTTVSHLMTLNTDIKNADIISNGQVINVPVVAYSTGNYIILTDVLTVREEPNVTSAFIRFEDMSENAKEQIIEKSNSKANGYVYGMIATVFEIKDNWGRTPTGWICLDYCEKYEI